MKLTKKISLNVIYSIRIIFLKENNIQKLELKYVFNVLIIWLYLSLRRRHYKLFHAILHDLRISYWVLIYFFVYLEGGGSWKSPSLSFHTTHLFLHLLPLGQQAEPSYTVGSKGLKINDCLANHIFWYLRFWFFRHLGCVIFCTMFSVCKARWARQNEK